MIEFNFSSKEILPLKIPKSYPDILKYEGEFTIKVDNKTFFEDPYFSIYEFIKFIDQWESSQLKNMIYSSVETEEECLIRFTRKCDGQWNIYSPWQLFQCDLDFSRDELEKALFELKRNINY